jgi:ribosomal protein S18 acetylase RimI-like enzyme
MSAAAPAVVSFQESARDASERVIIREAQLSDAFGITRAQVDTSRLTYRALLSRHVIGRLRFAAQLHCWQSILREVDRRVRVQVAEAHGELLGFAAGGPARVPLDDHPGELYAIYVLPKHQRRGLGARLFRSVYLTLAQHQLMPMFLWVLANNPAQRFFETLGGRPVPRALINRVGGASKGKTAFCWQRPPEFEGAGLDRNRVAGCFPRGETALPPPSTRLRSNARRPAYPSR